MTTYIIESEYYDGSKYADKSYNFEDLLAELSDIAKDETSETIGDSAKVRTDKLTVTIDE